MSKIEQTTLFVQDLRKWIGKKFTPRKSRKSRDSTDLKIVPWIQ